MSRPLDPLLPQSTEQEQLRSADSSLGIEKDSEQTLEVHTTSLHPLLSPTFSYNPIADLPVHLREPLPLPAIDADNFQPNLTEFWYTPANEMMEKQVRSSLLLTLFGLYPPPSPRSTNLPMNLCLKLCQ
jgi:hypothetical protein